MINRPRYTPPVAPFKPGDRVRYQSQIFSVIASTHTHTQLEDQRWAVPNWLLRKVRVKKERIRVERSQSPLTHLPEE